MPDLNTIDAFMNDVSDQAAAWYSIVTQQPVTVPSAQIAGQNYLAQPPIMNLAPVINSPGGLILGIAAIVLIVMLVRR